MSAAPTIVWQPNPGPQTWLIQCPVQEVFYGGARGGGKTDGVIGDWLEHSNRYGEFAVGVFFRRTHKQLDEVIARTKQLFKSLGATFRDLPHSEWTMANGARLKFRYIQDDKDAEEYQGHSYTRIYIEEVTNFPSPKPINLLRATLRPVGGSDVPCCMRLTGNPGGPGHHWVKKRYIDPAPKGFKILTESFSDPVSGKKIPMHRMFIPSKVQDNPKVGSNYVGALYQAANGDQSILKAWLKGDWEIIQGSFFDCFNPAIHVVPRDIWRVLPPGLQRFRAFDWGSAKPFSVGWYAISDGSVHCDGILFPPGAFIKYREWYGSAGGDDPNVGVKMSAEAVALGIVAQERMFSERIAYGSADPSIFIRNGGPSIAETMLRAGVSWRKADNKRIPGWEEMKHRLVGAAHPGEPVTPMLYFSAQCEDTIRTLPILQHDDKDMEDLDTDGEDHAADETRYACMSRPLSYAAPTSFRPLDSARAMPTIDEIIARRMQES